MRYNPFTKTTLNITINLISKFWIAGINIIFFPLYIKILGVDSYGLVGFYTTLLTSMTILDFGLSTTLNRELARSRELNEPSQSTRNMVFTIEIVYLIIGFCIGILVYLFAEIIATKWINSDHLSPKTIRDAIRLMGIVLALQWPISLYSGGLFGLERQALCGVINMIFSALRMGGVILVLSYTKNEISVFFIWQAAINFLHLLTLRILLWKSLPYHRSKRQFSLDSLNTVKKFAIGITIISIVSFGISYADKLVVSKMLTLEIFAYYAFSSSVAGGIGQFGGAITSAMFPKFSALASANKTDELTSLYHKSCKLMASLVLPIAITVIFFTADILEAWTHNPLLVSNTTNLTRVLIAGTALNCLMHLPYHLMLSKGITKFTIYQNILATIVAVPLLFFLTKEFGAIGASFVWFFVNLSYVMISIPLVHNLILPGETFKWYIHDTIIPLLTSVVILGFCKLIFINFEAQHHINIILKIIIIAFFCLLTISLNIPNQIKRLIFK